MKNFIKKYFLCINSIKDDEFARRRIIESDHVPYCALLFFIAVCQIFMLIGSFIKNGFSWDNPKDIIYRSAYIFLFCASIISILVLRKFRKKDNTLPYFTVCSFAMIAVLLWGAAISIGDSYSHGVDLTVYSYSTIGIAFIICLIPWIATCNILAVSALMTVILYLNPNTNEFIGIGSLVNVISVCFLSILGNVFNFYRRTSSTELEKKVNSLNESLSKLAVIDDLTKQYNRRYLTQLIDTKLNCGKNPSGVMLFDIDHFKNINDTYGHLVGDKCLSDLGEMISEFLSNKENTYCVRYGGEEFLIYFDKTNKHEILNKAYEFKEKVKEHVVTLDKVSLSFKISIGVALAEDNITYNNLINRADTALYKAKVDRDSVCCYDE